MIEQGLRTCQEADYHILDEFIRAEQAVRLARQGLAHARPADAAVEAPDEESWFTPEALRIEAEIAECEGRLAEAEARYLEALAMAERHGALIWQLRAATSLASLLLGQGQATEAEAALAPVYGQFSARAPRPVLSRAAACLDACRRAAASA
jgi:ATP/maltotriose-dependent transcriptional regulator MalT